MTHYEILGVDERATPDEIKKAYRRRAAETHPDKGGDENVFKAVNKAHQVLKNPALRAAYDATGESEPEQPLEVAVRAQLMQMFNTAIERAVNAKDFAAESIVKDVRKQLERDRGRSLAEIKNLEKTKPKLQFKRGQVTSKGEVNMIHMLIDQQLGQIDAYIEARHKEIELLGACLAELDLYTETLEPAKADELFTFLHGRHLDPEMQTFYDQLRNYQYGG